MPKTIFADGTLVTPAFLNAVNNPVFVDTPDNDGEVTKIDDADMSNAADQLKTTAYTYFDQLLVSEGASGLQLAYNGGVIILGDDTATTIASGTINAIDDSTSYVHVTTAGVVAIAAELPIRCISLARVVAGAGTISVIEDLRPRWQVLPRPDEIALNTDQSVAILQAPIAQGRLTLATGDPNPSTDQTAADTLYYTPFNGNAISLYNAAADRWDLYTFTERSLDISALAANTNFDIFIYDNSGTLTLEFVAWTNSGAGISVRNEAISQRDGIYIKSSDDRRYLGTIRITGVSGECEDSEARRFVWNAQNRIKRRMLHKYTSFHTYASSTLRYLNGSSSNSVNFVLGLDLLIEARFMLNARGNVSGLIGLNGLSVTSATDGISADASGSSSDTLGIPGFYSNVAFGYNFWAMLEQNKGNDANGIVLGLDAGVFQTGLEAFGEF